MSAVHGAVAAPQTRRRPGLTLALLAFAQLIISIDYNIVYVALPRIGSGLGFSADHLQWVVSAYAVAFGGFLLLGGRACDLVGKRRVFATGLALYAVSSLIGGLATEPGILLAGRALQGIGGALLFPATLALVFATFTEGRERNLALSAWAATGASGLIVGSLLGGLLAQWWGWNAVFFVNVPLAGLALALTVPLIPADPARAAGRAFDVPGAVTATAGVTLVVFTLAQGPATGWLSGGVVLPAIVGVALLAVFTAIELRSRDPLLPFRLFRNHNLSIGVCVTFLFMATFGTLLYFLTEYFQSTHGYSALRTGLALLVPMAAGFCGSISGGRIATRYGIRRTMVSALVIGTLGTVGLVVAMSDTASYVALLPGLVVLSLCQGVVFTTMYAAAGVGLAWQEQGIASGIVSTGQQIGSAVGLAVLVGIANAADGSGAAGTVGSNAVSSHGLRVSVWCIVAGMALTALVACGFRTDGTSPTAGDGQASADSAYDADDALPDASARSREALPASSR